jgi:uroporphyrinogen decarboxylase
MRNRVPDRVPVTPDISNYIPCKRTGLPFWDIYFNGKSPLWQAYINAAIYYGIEMWMASCTGAPFEYADARATWESRHEFDAGQDAMIASRRARTPDGDLTCRAVCYRADPPSPVEKLIKDFAADWKKYRWLLNPPSGINLPEVEKMRELCRKHQQALGYCIGYPGFQAWLGAVQGGVEQLSYALLDYPEILDEWFERDLAIGAKNMELLIAARPDYILFGGSGTITLASPDLAKRYALPALRKWSGMAKAAGIPTMLHSCGKERILVDLLCEETEVNCVNPLEIEPMGDVDLGELKRARGRQIALMGNLHTTTVMLKGTPAQVRQAAWEALRAAGDQGGFILSTGDQCPRDTPEANLFALVEAGHELGVYDQATGRLPALES